MPQFTEHFWTQDGLTLRRPDLACLRADADLYSILLLQLNEKLEYSDQGLWFTDPKAASEKFRVFFNLAVAKNVELAITPEYSCPWHMIDSLLREGILPNEHNLWVLGCASIHPHELQILIDKHPEVKWVYERELVSSQVHNKESFFDPVCMLLKSRDNNGTICTVAIVQFKTEHFGGTGNEWERDHLIKGNTFFVLSNQIASTRLVVQICSDALRGLNFNELQDGIFLHIPLLLIHIQLNKQPFQSNYKSYRNLLFAKGDKNFSKEIITLNWARGVHIEGNKWNSYGGSAFYLKSDKLDLKDNRVNQNHLRGLYYTNWEEKKTHIYFLAYDEYIFLVRNTKPSQLMADPAQHMRTGPEVMELYEWKGNWVHAVKADDGFCILCEEIEKDGHEVSCAEAFSDPLNTERIIAITLGNIENGPDWHQPQKLPSFRIKEDEHNRRVNFNHDPQSDAQNERRKKILQFTYFKQYILNDPRLLPERLKSPILKYDFASEKEDRFLINLHPANGGHKWTGIYLAIDTITNARAIRDKVCALFRDNHQGKNVIVWYDHGKEIRREFNELSLPNIAENTSRPQNSYKKRSKK